MFTKSAPATDQKTSFTWGPALGSGKTCLHGTNLSPEPRPKVAAFDLDGCIIQSSFGNGSSKSKGKPVESTFQWWKPVVPKKLKEVHDEGYEFTSTSM